MVKILERRDTAVNWALQNPVLAEGERGFDTTNGLFKIGNGVSTWDALPEYNHSCLVRMGLWDPSTGSYPSNPEKGWYYVCNGEGEIDSIAYHLRDWIVYNGSGWDKVNNYQPADGAVDTITYVNSNPTFLADGVNHLVQANAADVDLEIALPNLIAGTKVKIKKIDTSNHTVRITPTGFEYNPGYIDDKMEYILEYQNEFVYLECDGSGWLVIGE